MTLGDRNNPGIVEFCLRYVRIVWGAKVSSAAVTKVKVV